MRPVGVWLVPVSLVLIGFLLIGDAAMISEDAAANTAYRNSTDCSGHNGTSPGPPCATLSCIPECGYAAYTGILGGLVLASGASIGLARWSRSRSRPRR